MSRLKTLFERKNKRVLNVYCTAGYPQVNNTLDVIKAVQDSGADIVELGIPYSDPLADGPVIQASSAVALSEGMTMDVLLQQLQQLRTASSNIHIPVVLMGYLNPVLQYGFERFCKAAAAAGVDGLILPDLPAYEYEQEYKAIVTRYGLDFIFLVTPETSKERVQQLDALTTGFLYAVSSSSVTGSDKDFNAVADYLQRLQSYNLQNPVLVGFGIKDKTTFNTVCQYANGAIIGSAYVQAIAVSKDIAASTRSFIQPILS